MAKISAIIPSYNDEETISPCLDSILNQDYGDYEVLVCLDPESDDKTERIVKEKDKVRLLLCKGRGKVPAMREGFRISKGDVICVMDADVIVDKDFLRKGYESMENSDITGSLMSSASAGVEFVPSIRAFLWRRKDDKDDFVTPGGSNFYTREAFRREIFSRPAKDPDLIEPVEFADLDEEIKESLRVHEISEVRLRYLLRKSYQAGIRSVLAFKKLRRKKEAISSLIFSLFPITIVILAATCLFLPLILLICAYSTENTLYAMRFQKEFRRSVWTFKLFFLRPLMHICTSLGAYKGWVRLIRGSQETEG